MHHLFSGTHATENTGTDRPKYADGAISIAFVHILFNLIGVSIFMLIPYFQKLPIFLAQWIGEITLKRRWYGFAYILTVFFIIPVFLIVIIK